MANATSNPGRLHPQTLGTRLSWIALGITATIVLGVARSLTPSAHGLGTHTQLGLPACLFHTLTGLPCPACGLTTAFAHLARGEWNASIAAHALGIPLFFATAMMVPISIAGAARAWPLFLTLQRTLSIRAVAVITLAFAVTWATRLLGIWLA